MIYLLFYDCDNGDRENWNTFYTPVEAFDCPAKRDARWAVLSAQDPELERHDHDIAIQ
jgi:hypothetical protein